MNLPTLSLRFDRRVFLAWTIVAIVFAIDLSLPLGVASAVPHTFAVLAAVSSRSRRTTIAVASVCAVLTLAKMAIVPDRGETELWKVIANRCLALLSISVTTVIGLKRLRADERRHEAEEQTRLHLADLAHMGRLKAAGQLAIGLAHELKQPLAAISLQSEIAARLLPADASVPPSVRDALREITEQSQRAAAVISSLQHLVRKSEPQRLPVDLNAVVRESVRLIESQVRRAGVTLDLQLSPALPAVTGDTIQLEQVLLNLLQNALDSVRTNGPDGRLIRVTTVPIADQVRVSVRDSGSGLSPADVERVFERFQSQKPHGMGLGLAISRSIVEAHRGRLWAEVNADRGATFHFLLPSAGTSS